MDSPEETVEVEFEAHDLLDPRGRVYHTLPAEKCRMGIVTRFDGRQELAFVRNSGAWLPPVFKP